ncbi:MAG TPA: succinylglutamate desuccinylase/aspartoacylase family protein [Candidatus Dormibacteraeota bacterium]
MSRTQVGEITAEPGRRSQGWVTIPGVEPAWEIPVVVNRGREPGPTLAVTAGMHAAEYVPIEAVTRLSRWVDPTALRGTLLTVLLVNTPGFYERSIYLNPRDGRNLNRAFPGNPGGLPSERVAAFLLAELIEGADAYVDAHCGDMNEALAPFALWADAPDPGVRETSHEMARAYGFERTLAEDPALIRDHSVGAAALAGVPAIVAEVGQQGICDEASVSRHLRGLQNVMAHLGMIEPVGPPAEPPRELAEMAWMRTDISATYHPTVVVGEQVGAGQVVGELRDVFGATLRELHSVAEGEVVFCVTSLAVKAGDPLLGIGVLPH